MLLPFMEFLKSYEEFSVFDRRLYFWSFMFIFCALVLIPQNYLVHTILIISLAIRECKRAFKNDVIPFLKSKKALKAS